jgi:phosphodiesterase/alkaline phosphatase D-like protein
MATVTWTWLGAVSASGATVTGKIAGATNGSSSIKLRASLASGGTPIDGVAATLDANGYFKATVTGLAARTSYIYSLLIDGVATSALGTFKTFPAAGAQTSFQFGFSSCANGESNALPKCQSRNPDFFVHMGDFGYYDLTVNDQAQFRSKVDGVFARPNHKAFFATVPTAYVWSDHDFSNNDSWGAGTGAAASEPAAQAVYRETVPHYSLPSTDGGIYQTFAFGRVRFILTDNRSYKDPLTKTDDASKTLLGATQKAWFKQQITNATEQLIIWVSENPWIEAKTAGSDRWGGYDTERTELANYIVASGKKVVIISGDMHSLAYDDGSHSAGNIPVFHAAPLYNTGSVKGGPYSTAAVPGSTTTPVQQYGYMTVTDTGTSITLDFKGYDATDTQKISASKTFAVTSTGGSTGGTTGGGTTGGTTPVTLSNIVATPSTNGVTLTWDSSVAADSKASMWLVPKPLINWDWQIGNTGAIHNSGVQLYDIDGFDHQGSEVPTGALRVAYFSAGTYEPNRPDSSQFPASVKGNAVQGWPGEYWLDVRAISVLKPIMAARADLAKSKGFDGIEWDNVDSYDGNNPGFPVSSADQLAYNKMLAQIAHERGMFVLLKNDAGQASQLVGDFDGVLTEQAWEYGDQPGYAGFTAASKVWLDTEYSSGFMNCADAISKGASQILSTLDLNASPTTQCVTSPPAAITRNAQTPLMSAVMATSHSITFSNLTAGQKYGFMVMSKDAAGNIAYSTVMYAVPGGSTTGGSTGGTTGGSTGGTGGTGTPSPCNVAAAPLGPPAPVGGWTVEFADSFCLPLVDGRVSGNRTRTDANGKWLFGSPTSGDRDGFNDNEIQKFNNTQISVDSRGLVLTAAYDANRGTNAAGLMCNYVSGYVYTTDDSTSDGFQWMPGGGSTLCFEIVTQFAPQFDGGPTNGGNDEGWWASGGPPIGSWVDEFDFFEHWGYTTPPTNTGDVWVYQTSPFTNVSITSKLSTFLGADPSAALHRFTTVINPDNSWAWYADGKLIGTHTPPPSFQRVWMKLLLSYALRNPSAPDPRIIPGFMSGSREWIIRSVAVYQDTPHAGQNVRNGGLAPSAAACITASTARRCTTARGSSTSRSRPSTSSSPRPTCR